ncbi:hypothetical protein ACS0PU_007763 [Formica fusca]
MVDLGGYIIILTNDDGKIKLYGSPADNADTLEVGDEILEVNGRTLENATHNEVIQYIHQCIKSRTICLRLRRRSGNQMGNEEALHCVLECGRRRVGNERCAKSVLIPVHKTEGTGLRALNTEEVEQKQQTPEQRYTRCSVKRCRKTTV